MSTTMPSSFNMMLTLHENVSASLALCEENLLVTVGFPLQRASNAPLIYYDVSLNRYLNGQLFDTPCRQCDSTVIMRQAKKISITSKVYKSRFTRDSQIIHNRCSAAGACSYYTVLRSHAFSKIFDVLLFQFETHKLIFFSKQCCLVSYMPQKTQ